MPVPRYRGYGFRNIDGWEVRDTCARTGRNLNIASAGVLLYLVSGASIDTLSVGGASVNIAYPAAFLCFGLIGFIWLGYRFLVAYRDATDVDPWWHLYMRDILLVGYPVSAYIQRELTRRFVPPNLGSYTMSSSHPSVRTFGVLSGAVVIAEIRLGDIMVARSLEIAIPRSQIVRAHMHCLPRYLISNNDVADMWVPWLLYFLAVAAILAECLGLGAAGLYGLLPVKP